MRLRKKKFVCDDCSGEFWEYPSKTLGRFHLRCPHCGSYAVDFSKASIGRDELAEGHDAYKSIEKARRARAR